MFFLFACSSVTRSETPLPVEAPVFREPLRLEEAGGTVDEIRRSIEIATPSSLIHALDLIQNQAAINSEFGRTMNAIGGILLRTIYPSINVRLLPQDFPQNNVYAGIIRNAERGIYTAPSSEDYLEHVLPFLAFYPEQYSTDQLLVALPDLKKGAVLNPASVLAPYFMGVIY